MDLLRRRRRRLSGVLERLGSCLIKAFLPGSIGGSIGSGPGRASLWFSPCSGRPGICGGRVGLASEGAGSRGSPA